MQNSPADRTANGGKQQPGGQQPPNDVLVTVVTFVVLVLFGMALALVGTFFYSAGPALLVPICFDLAILASCLLGGWGLGRPAGALGPAVGWIVVAFALASGTSGGSVLITATGAGELFLFGGAACATAGVIAAFTIWSRSGLARSRRRP